MLPSCIDEDYTRIKAETEALSYFQPM
jgi:hypothetical protein